MNRRAGMGAIVALIICVVFSFPFVAEDEAPEAYEVEGLQRISLNSVIDWEGSWEYSRAVAAATILSWFHDRGYVELYGDLDGDGTIAEPDAIELANLLAESSMACEQAQSMTDAWLVIGLAQYVASRYPDGFELRIYDVGFPGEFERVLGIPFAPDAIPGILLAVAQEPTFASYTTELLDEAGVILGLEQEMGRNRYFTGHSFLRNPIAVDTYGISFLSPQEDWFAAGTQGRVLQTSARQRNAFYVDFQGEWVTVESMVALRSLLPHVDISSKTVCDRGASTCTVTVEASVRKTGEAPMKARFNIILEVDNGETTQTIARTVMPEDINPTGQTTVLFTFPIALVDAALDACTYSLNACWFAHPGSLIGLIVDAIPVPQTIHYDDEPCNGFYYGEGCCEDVPDCLDLAITTAHPSCTCEDVIERTWHPEPVHPQGGWWEIEVVGETCEARVRYTVRNIGTIDSGPYSVRTETSSGYTDTVAFSSLTHGSERSRWFECIVHESGLITITLTVESEMNECDEENNTAHETFFCH